MSTVLCAIAIKHAYVWLHATTVKDVKRSSSPRTFLLKKVRYSSPFISKVGSNLGFFFFPLSLSFSLFAYIHICIVTIVRHILQLYALLFLTESWCLALHCDEATLGRRVTPKTQMVISCILIMKILQSSMHPFGSNVTMENARTKWRFVSWKDNL